MQYKASSYAEGVFDTYWFEKNLQGDIVAVYSAAGTKLITYTYDAWGNCTVTYHNGGDSCMARYNPFRYRGYYYDSEIGLYYLNSRYYDPVVGQFINGDVFVSTGQGLLGNNMFVYCNNNPVNGVDPVGYSFETLWDVISLGSSVVEVALNPYDPWAWIGLAGDAADVLIPFIGGIGETTRALKAASQATEIIDSASNVKKGWKVGEDITNLTKAGNPPSWSTLRSRYWKNKAHFFEGDYSDANLARMKRGLAPLYDDGDGLYSMELHHMLGRENEYYYLFFEVTPDEHSIIDPFRYFK